MSGGKPRQRDAMNASDPTRQMALVGRAGVGSDFGQPRPPFPNKLDRPLQSEVHDVAMRSHADRSGEYPREMKRAATGNLGQSTSLDMLIEMGNDVVPEADEHLLAQPTARQALEF